MIQEREISAKDTLWFATGHFRQSQQDGTYRSKPEKIHRSLTA